MEWSVFVKEMKVPFLLGSGIDADVVVKDESVSSTHAHMKMSHGRPTISDMSSQAGTFVSYSGDPDQMRQIHGENALKPSSLISLGNFGPIKMSKTIDRVSALLGTDLRFTDCLVMMMPPLHLDHLPWVIGSDEDNDLVLKGVGILGRHAQIDIQSGRYVLKVFGPGETYLRYDGYQRESLVSDVNALQEGSAFRLGEAPLAFHVLTFHEGGN